MIKIPSREFNVAFREFQDLVKRKWNRPFQGFDRGDVANWENYKFGLREQARSFLQLGGWSKRDIGKGKILKCTSSAIAKVRDSKQGNNLVDWRDHDSLLKVNTSSKRRHEIEGMLFDLYKGNRDEGEIFERLAHRDLVGGKYPVIAYLFFLKDMERFMPLRPKSFDKAFRRLGIKHESGIESRRRTEFFRTERQCSWDNYVDFNATLEDVRRKIVEASGFARVRLIDAHSFCWVLNELRRQEKAGTLESDRAAGVVAGLTTSERRAIAAMCNSIVSRVRNASGQTVTRKVKNKELGMSPEKFEKYMVKLFADQRMRCKFTGTDLKFGNPNRNLRPSLDRINSEGKYDKGNVQWTCWFINRWKGSDEDKEFEQLLELVRRTESQE